MSHSPLPTTAVVRIEKSTDHSICAHRVQWLVGEGADIDACTSKGGLVQWCALLKKHFNLVDWFLSTNMCLYSEIEKISKHALLQFDDSVAESDRRSQISGAFLGRVSEWNDRLRVGVFQRSMPCVLQH